MLPAQPEAIAAAVVGDAFAPYHDITRKMAGFHQALFDRWMRHTAPKLEEQLELTRIALEDGASDVTHPPKDAAELLGRAADAMGLSVDTLLATERQFSLIQQLRGESASNSEPLRALARRLDAERAAPARAASTVRREEESQRAIDDLAELARGIADIAQRAAQLVYDFQQPVDFAAMDEAIAIATKERLEKGLYTLTGLRQELKDAADYPALARSISAEIGRTSLTAVEVIESQLALANEDLETARVTFFEFEQQLFGRLLQISAERGARRVRERNAKARVAAEGLDAQLEALEAQGIHPGRWGQGAPGPRRLAALEPLAGRHLGMPTSRS